MGQTTESRDLDSIKIFDLLSLVRILNHLIPGSNGVVEVPKRRVKMGNHFFFDPTFVSLWWKFRSEASFRNSSSSVVSATRSSLNNHVSSGDCLVLRVLHCDGERGVWTKPVVLVEHFIANTSRSDSCCHCWKSIPPSILFSRGCNGKGWYTICDWIRPIMPSTLKSFWRRSTMSFVRIDNLYGRCEYGIWRIPGNRFSILSHQSLCRQSRIPQSMYPVRVDRARQSRLLFRLPSRRCDSW